MLLISQTINGQNSLVGDGFGGRLWYKPYNYTVGSYSAYSICDSDRQLLGWGSNQFGQLGIGTNIGSPMPTIIPGMNRVYYFSTGYLMGAIREDRSGWVWGNAAGNLPTKVIDNVTFVDAGINICAFVKSDGSVFSVGANYHGQFGNGAKSWMASLIPSQMKNIHGAVRTAQGQYTTCVLLDDGTVWCAGSDIGGGLGNGISDTSTHLEPIQVNVLSNIIDIKANTISNLALDEFGDVWIWGTNLATNSNAPTPVKIDSLHDIVAISGCNDGTHFMALDEEGICYSFGGNMFGQCGQSITTFSVGVKDVSDHVVDIMAGETFSYLIKDDGSLWASGTTLGSSSNSIWLNLIDSPRYVFTKIDPNIDSFALCQPSEYTFPTDIVNLSGEDIPIFFPNAFSPNEDGLNSIYRAIQSSKNLKIEHYHLSIYNRWGNLLFHTHAIDQGWDGKYRNVTQPIETYFYMATYNLPGKSTRVIKGDLVLIR
ncbi:MAG: gliding motility-associated C-terminal domain-containing protein [Bacteroidetes bacterium]|nr:gliding motility-associated C-terminal domain-containing protein [Bacteroidota bacterium]